MTIAMITPPSLEPLSLSEVKEHLRLDHDHEDTVVDEILRAARQHTENVTGQKLITQVWRQYESSLPLEFCIPTKLSPVQSISAVTIFDIDGTPQVLAQNQARLVRGSQPQLVEIDSSLDPSAAKNGLEIDLVVGHGDLGLDVPDTLKRAILLLIAHWYEFRGAVAPSNQPVSMPPGFDALVRPYKRMKL